MQPTSEHMANDNYNVLRDEVVPLMKDLADNLSNLIGNQNRLLESRRGEEERRDMLVRLAVNQENMEKKLDKFISSQDSHDARFRDLENKVTRLLAYGGAAIMIVSLVIRYIGK